jgi:hypothetical protein
MNDPTEPARLSPAQRRAAEELIGEERVRTVRLIDSLMRQWDDIVEASALTTLRRLDSSRVGNRRRLVETKDQAYELRLLHVPALYTMAR